MIGKRLWNAIVVTIFNARRYCLGCGKKMQRVTAVEERFIRTTSAPPTGGGGGRLGVNNPQPSAYLLRKVEVTPIYDVCDSCDRRIRNGGIKTRLN